MFDDGFCDLRASAVARAQEQQSRPSSWSHGQIGLRRTKRQAGMERHTRCAKEIPAAEQISAVVDVTAVGRASAAADDAGVPQPGQVVGNQVLRLSEKLHEFADAAIAASELAHQTPSQRIAEQSEDLRR